ncbi:putative nuclease HARBI1 [Sitophilus oryzae]|uniref:Nuclease HARBI1 n=1 Tax=Sitophilus oryzae TaxID=7048 RepID=A0A6J2Y2Q7_SITOR|nr:putative nuclease HARBI1 [Sitophilus oryzae]
MDENSDCLMLLYLSTVLLLIKKQQITRRYRRKPKRFGVHPIFLARERQGFYQNLLKEARLSDPLIFFNFTRMSAASFDKLLSFTGPFLTKTSRREPISPGCRLALTFRFLATGDSYPSLSYSFRIGVTTICNIIRETTLIIWNVLHPRVLPIPSEQKLREISNGFLRKWSLPNCVGAIDGKHVTIQAPNNSGSTYFNYKKNFSIVLLAVCDSSYMFTYVDVGAYGSQSDSGVLHQSSIGKKLFENNLNLPVAEELPNCPLKTKVPYFFVGDEAFPLRENLMRPFSKPRVGPLPREQRIYNYRLSRARRTIENTFGIMVARFRVLHRVINANPVNVDNIIKAIVCLHNFIIKENNPHYIRESDVDKEQPNLQIQPGAWRNDIPKNGLAIENLNVRIGARNASFSALAIRNYLKDYVNGPGAGLAPWQWEIIDQTN